MKSLTWPFLKDIFSKKSGPYAVCHTEYSKQTNTLFVFYFFKLSTIRKKYGPFVFSHFVITESQQQQQTLLQWHAISG